MRYLTLAVLATAMLLPEAAHGESSPLTASATRGGLRLTISIPHAQYPQNALALVTLTVQNVGKRPVSIQISNAQEDMFQPSVEVRDEHGNPSSLPTAQHFFPMPGPLPSFARLQPGRSCTRHRHVVLTGPQLVASQTFGSFGNQKSVTAPPIRLTLAPSKPATLVISENDPAGLSATVETVGHGHLYVSQSETCPQGGGTAVISDFFWVRAKGSVIKAPCTSPSEWHVIAGYPGQPVGTLDYTPSTS